MMQSVKGPFETAVFRCANGDASHGVRAVNGAAICWCSDYANAEFIAEALNRHAKIYADTELIEPMAV